MRYCFAVALLVSGAAHPNPAIDMDGYLRVAREAAEHRETRRVSEAEFIHMSREPGTVILDARSREKFDELHVAGAINLPFPDIAIKSLRAAIPDKEHAHPDLLQQQLFECRGAFPRQDRARFAQSLDLHRPLQLRLSQRVRARSAHRSQGVETRVR